MNKKQEDLLDSVMDQLPLRNIVNIATCYGKQATPKMTFVEAVKDFQRRSPEVEE